MQIFFVKNYLFYTWITYSTCFNFRYYLGTLLVYWRRRRIILKSIGLNWRELSSNPSIFQLSFSLSTSLLKRYSYAWVQWSSMVFYKFFDNIGGLQSLVDVFTGVCFGNRSLWANHVIGTAYLKEKDKIGFHHDRVRRRWRYRQACQIGTAIRHRRPADEHRIQACGEPCGDEKLLETYRQFYPRFSPVLRDIVTNFTRDYKENFNQRQKGEE